MTEPNSHDRRILAETRYLRLVQEGHWTYAQRPNVTGANRSSSTRCLAATCRTGCSVSRPPVCWSTSVSMRRCNSCNPAAIGLPRGCPDTGKERGRGGRRR